MASVCPRKPLARRSGEWNADEIIVATKCGVLPQEDNKPRRFISSSTIREEVEGSLRRLGRDWIDLYQIHWPDPLENLAESWETLQELRKEGKIRWAGVCNCWKEELELLDSIEAVTSNQPMYSMLARDIEPEVLPWCGGKGTGVLVYSPMHSGLLTGKFPASGWTGCRITTGGNTRRIIPW